MTINDFENLFMFAGGLGMFLFGVHSMSGGVQKCAGEQMRKLLGILTNNRFVGVLVGALITAVIQSSGATTVMIIGFINAGLMNLSQAVGPIMGANIGTCITAFLSSLGGSKNARRTAMVHFYFNLIGSIAFLVTIYAVQYAVGFSFWENPIDKGGIANFHTLFNVTMTVLWLPLVSVMVKIVMAILPEKPRRPRDSLADTLETPLAPDAAAA